MRRPAPAATASARLIAGHRPRTTRPSATRLPTPLYRRYIVDSKGGRNAWGVAHDWHREEVLELFKAHDFHFQCVELNKDLYDKTKSTNTAFPPAPKWRPNENWD